MPFKYPCFISYARGQGLLVNSFLKQLKDLLNAYLDLYFEEQLYEDGQLTPGDRHVEELADAICHSVCMVVVYSPRYGSSEYCVREYRAMEILEEKRLALLGDNARGRGMIIPIILRGQKEDIPERIRNHIHYCDFSKFTTADSDIIRDRAYIAEIEKIVGYIFRLRQDLERLGEDVCCECPEFMLPAEVDLWSDKPPRPAPLPFSGGRK